MRSHYYDKKVNYVKIDISHNYDVKKSVKTVSKITISHNSEIKISKVWEKESWIFVIILTLS